MMFKDDIFQAEIRELGDAHDICQVPPLYELLNATIDEPLYWYPVVNFRKLLHKLMIHTNNNF